MAVPDKGSDGYSPFRQILLDTPTTAPALRFAEIGRAFASIISESQAQFSVGIFGGWGSGKTTLMAAIKSALPQETVVSVEFNAWRFEREPQLLIPLLDTIRAALVRWSESESRELATRKKVLSLAARIGRIVHALATGLSAQVGLPGAATVSYDVGNVLEALSDPEEPQTAQSLYVAAFAEMKKVFDEFSAGGISRVVVFVDDLDRCLPGNALDVLESTKLFFDLPGFVFVMGLDEEIVERAVRSKFASQDDDPETKGSGRPEPSATRASQRLAREYVKKIFQLPYSLPAMVPQQLDDLLDSMYRAGEHDPEEFERLRRTVRPYLRYVAIERRVNPREVKRFINAYILQRLTRSELDSDTVLALQTLAFRYDWQSIYVAILADSQLFVSILKRYREDEGRDIAEFEDLSPDLEALEPGLASYLRSDLAEPLTRYETLDQFLSSIESTRGGPSWELDAYRHVGRLRREIRNALTHGALGGAGALPVFNTLEQITNDIEGFIEEAIPAQDTSGFRVHLTQIRALLRRKPGEFDDADPDAVRATLLSLQAEVENIRSELRILRNDSILRP